MAGRVHRLKCRQPYFELLAAGVKTFEVRPNDRAFAVGDDAVAAALPVIEKELRAHIADEIEQLREADRAERVAESYDGDQCFGAHWECHAAAAYTAFTDASRAAAAFVRGDQEARATCSVCGRSGHTAIGCGPSAQGEQGEPEPQRCEHGEDEPHSFMERRQRDCELPEGWCEGPSPVRGDHQEPSDA